MATSCVTPAFAVFGGLVDHRLRVPSGSRSSSANRPASVDPNALANLSAETMEGVLSALSTAPM